MRPRRWDRSPALILLLCLLVGGCASRRAADPTSTPGIAVMAWLVCAGCLRRSRARTVESRSLRP